jgi:hypothetical protein
MKDFTVLPRPISENNTGTLPIPVAGKRGHESPAATTKKKQSVWKVSITII